MASRTSAERRKREQQKTIYATIGYCFVIVLVVLFVMSRALSSTYVKALKVERSEMMKSVAVSSAVALSHVNIAENMNYPLPVYTYDDGKEYITDIYTKAGNSFLRLYTSQETKEIGEYTLSGVSEKTSAAYNDCFQLQQVTLTTRTEGGVSYVCAIAPIISAQNTVGGILEIRMPASDFESTVNGMSLSWMFTIFSIAVSAGIIIYEFNLLISTLSRGIKSNVPVIIMYGKDACKFVSFFFAFSAVMQPVVVATYLKKSLTDVNTYAVYGIIAAALFLYAVGFFGFMGIRKSIKDKLTSKVALLASMALSYVFSILAGILNIPYLLVAFMLPIALCTGMANDYLRDYRTNAARTRYEGYDDMTVHKIQSVSYFLGISVGTVISGIFLERFGILVVMIVSGACLILTAFAMTYFMRNNQPVKESYLPVNIWMESLTDKFTGKLLMSGFFILGFVFAFMIGFVPNYLGNVGISVPTAAFYYLLCAFVACFAVEIIKKSMASALTSKVRILLSSGAVVLGLALFALIPTAKVLVITCALFGISLGVHDYTYLYIVHLLAKDRIRFNIRRSCEVTFLFAVLIFTPVLTMSISFPNKYTSVILLASTVIIAIIGFLYPFSSASRRADDILTGNMNPAKGGNEDGNVE